MDQKDEVKSRLDLVEVIREYIPLKAVGVNFQARCPFHREKTPSFVVSPERQIWKCFGCGKGGDVFSFVMEIEGLSFIEALRQLAPKAGVQLKRQNPREVSRRNNLLDIMVLAVKYYHKILVEDPRAKPALDYLRGRGLNDETIEHWQIGYSRDSWDDILNVLKNKGFSEQEIFLSGLAVKKENANSFYDRFRGRIMFPINDINGNPVAFSARVSPEKEQTEKMGKYINSPQTPIYDKSKILFGLDKAKQFIREAGFAIIAEGQMDVISSYQADVKNIVASSGTAMSAEQIKLIKRYTDNILFSFDADSAGELAAERGIEQALAQDMNIKIIQVPGGKDPDECVRNNVADWKRAVANAVGIVDYYFDKTFKDLDLSDISNKKSAATKILKAAKAIKNKIEQDSWLKRLAEKLQVNESSLREVLNSASVKKARFRASELEKKEQTKPKADFLGMLSEYLLSLLLKFPQHLAYAVDNIKPQMLSGKANKEFYKKLIIYYNRSTNNSFVFEADNFKFWLKDNIEDEQELANLGELADFLLLLSDKDFYDLSANDAKVEINRIIKKIKRKFFSVKMFEIEERLSVAEREKDSRRIEELTTNFQVLAEEMRNLNN